MKRFDSILLLVLLFAALNLTADTTSDAFVQQFLPNCEEAPKMDTKPFTTGIGQGMTARLVSLESGDPWCAGLWLEVTRGRLGYVGQPWILAGYEGTVAEKIRQFAWERMKETANATVGTKPDQFGLTPVQVSLTTEYGRIPLEGVVDSSGEAFYPGGFISRDASVLDQRMQMIQPLLGSAPAKTSKQTRVELVEFSDFQCPSCRHASEWLEPLLADYGDRITYRRVDFPLMSAHPWAFPAALYGRAIHRQDPDKFWLFKKEIFGNQDKLSIFSLEDFATGFVEEQGLDLSRFQRDIASQELRDELLRGIAIGMMAEVNGTPTFWVNGKPVAVGAEGAHLREILDLEIAREKKN